MIRNILIPSLVLASLMPNVAWAQEAESLGPAPVTFFGGSAGRISALIAHPTDPSTLYASGADAGVWRTIDAGQTWHPLTDHMPTTAIGALAMDPADPDILYVGTGEANFANHSRYGLGLFKSIDAGETWVHLAHETFAGRCFSRIVIDPTNTSVLYASIARAGGFPELAAAKGHPRATAPLGVFKSTDAGETWARLDNLPDLSATDLAIDATDPRVLYAAVGRIFGHPDNGIYKTTDAGATWSKLTVGLPSNVGRISVTVSPDDPSRVMAVLTNPSSPSGGDAFNLGVYRSLDAGASWSSVGSVNQATYGWYLSCIAFQPGNPNVAIVGGLELERTTNNGSSWANITPPHVDMHAIAWDAAGRLLIASDGGVHRSENLGNSWQSLNTNLSTVQFYAGISTHPTLDDWFIAGAQDNGTNRRDQDTTLWETVNGGDGGWTCLDQTRPNRVFVESQGTANLYRSTNAGDSFSFVGGDIFGRNCFLPPYLIDPANPDRMLYATERLFQSLDGGSNWSPLSADLTDGAGAIRAIAIAPSDPIHVYAATNDGNVLASTDAGATFTLIRDNNPGWPRVTREIEIHPTDPRTMYLAVASFNADQVLRTTDGGQSFEPLDGDLPDVPVNVIAVDPRGANGRIPVLYAGADDGLYRSVNAGVNWHRYAQGFPRVAVIDLSLDGAREVLIIATQGRGAWRVPIAIPGDLNCDGSVTREDLFEILRLASPADPGQVSGPCDLLAAGDLNGDGTIDARDFWILLDLIG